MRRGPAGVLAAGRDAVVERPRVRLQAMPELLVEDPVGEVGRRRRLRGEEERREHGEHDGRRGGSARSEHARHHRPERGRSTASGRDSHKLLNPRLHRSWKPAAPRRVHSPLVPAAQPCSRAVLITGCSSGIGAATALHLAGHGWDVWATARDPERLTDLRAAGCRTLALDLTDQASMAEAVAAVRLRHPRGRDRAGPDPKRLRRRGGRVDRAWGWFLRRSFPSPGAGKRD